MNRFGNPETLFGIDLIESKQLPFKRARLKLSPAVLLTDEFRRKIDDSFLEMFGEESVDCLYFPEKNCAYVSAAVYRAFRMKHANDAIFREMCEPVVKKPSPFFSNCLV